MIFIDSKDYNLLRETILEFLVVKKMIPHCESNQQYDYNMNNNRLLSRALSQIQW
jgi:hypothetical protein